MMSEPNERFMASRPVRKATMRIAKKVSPADFRELSIAERILLLEEMWDSIAATPDGVPVTAAQQREVNRRLAAYRRDRKGSHTWEEVKAKITGQGELPGARSPSGPRGPRRRLV